MKIVVNTRLLRKGAMDGIGWFAFNTLKYIAPQHPDIEFHCMFDSAIDEEFLFSPNIVPHKLFPPAKHAVLNVWWFEWSLRNFLKRMDPDLFYSPDGILCLGWKGKQHGVVHDINFHHIPQDLKWTNRQYYNYFFPKYIQRANGLATVSEFSKQDIVQTYGANPENIDVVYNGINDFFSPLNDITRREVKARYTSGSDYFIFVGTLHPRKNILRLMEAFNQFKQTTASPMKLVLAGKEMYRTTEMHECKERLQYKDDIIFTGRLEDQALKHLLGAAFALVFVPYFEGFGIPIIEAMQCDVPVIASNVTSMPEVAGDAALLVDPFNVHDIARAMQLLTTTPLLREELIEKGRVRKNFFSWEKSGRLLWNSIERTL